MTKGIYTVAADAAKNRMTIRIEGFLSEAEAKGLAGEIISQGMKLKPGFGVISDVSQARPFDEAGALHIQRAQGFLQRQGMHRIIRVFDPRVILSKMQLERKGKETGFSIKQESARSLAEAERMLEEDSQGAA